MKRPGRVTAAAQASPRSLHSMNSMSGTASSSIRRVTPGRAMQMQNSVRAPPWRRSVSAVPPEGSIRISRPYRAATGSMTAVLTGPIPRWATGPSGPVSPTT